MEVAEMEAVVMEVEVVCAVRRMGGWVGGWAEEAMEVVEMVAEAECEVMNAARWEDGRAVAVQVEVVRVVAAVGVVMAVGVREVATARPMEAVMQAVAMEVAEMEA